jgi:hypothetical protein
MNESAADDAPDVWIAEVPRMTIAEPRKAPLSGAATSCGVQ